MSAATSRPSSNRVPWSASRCRTAVARPDRREQGPDVGVVVDLQQPGGHGGRGARPLEPGERRHVLGRGIGDEGPGQRLQPQAPVRPHQRHDRLPDLGGRQIPAAGAHPVQHERLDPVRVPRRDRGGELTSLRGPEQAETAGAHRVGHRQRRGHLPVERQVDPVPVGQAAPGLVIADHGEPLGQALDEGAEGEQLQLPAQVGDPARIAQQRRAGARRRVGDPAGRRAAVPDPRPHPSRLALPASAVKPPGLYRSGRREDWGWIQNRNMRESSSRPRAHPAFRFDGKACHEILERAGPGGVRRPS